MIHVAIMFYIVCSRPIFCGFCCVQCPVKSSYSHSTIAYALKTILKRWTFFINKEYNGNWYNGDLSGDFKCIFDVFEPINVLSKRPPLFRLAIKLLTLNIGSDSVILSLHRIRIGPINFRRVFYGIYYIGLLHLFFFVLIFPDEINNNNFTHGAWKHSHCGIWILCRPNTLFFACIICYSNKCMA